MWQYEHQAKALGYNIIAGIDEAGRGPLAGPVVSAAVILPPDCSIPGINDSKKLSEKQRDSLYPQIIKSALAVSTGLASPEEIDRINILKAALLSMKRAVNNLSGSHGTIIPEYLLIDGKFTIDMPIKQTAIIKGDSKSISIAAASIIAKVTRDAIMKELHKQYPEYNFKQHKGYPTKAHKEAIRKYGHSPVHRMSFKGVINND
jgi:ribonuclease HII